MKTLFLGAALALANLATPTYALDSDMHIGLWSGNWCGYDARFKVLTRDGDDWIFGGRIEITSTGEDDRLWIEQYSNQSLRIIRYVGGTSQKQVVQTDPPAIIAGGGGVPLYKFTGRGYGYGCDNTTSWLFMSINRS